MSRDQLIQQLLLETVHQIVEQGRTTWLQGILEHGFAGYANLGEADLDAAARRLGLTLADESEIPLADEDDLDDLGDMSFGSHYAGLPESMLRDRALDYD